MTQKSPLQEIMDSVESGISSFGLPPLPPLSKLVPNKKEEVKEPGESITSILKEGDVKEAPRFEAGSLAMRDNRYSHVDFDATKMNIYGGKDKGEITPLESKIVPRQIFVEEDKK